MGQSVVQSGLGFFFVCKLERKPCWSYFYFIVALQEREEQNFPLKHLCTDCRGSYSCNPSALLPCCTAGGYPEQLDAGGAALEGTKSLLCQESCCMCWWQMTSSVCLRAALASFYLSHEKDTPNERCFLQLVMAFSETLLWELDFVWLVLHHESACVCPGAVGQALQST